MNKQQAIEILEGLYVTERDIDNNLYNSDQGRLINQALAYAIDSIQGKQGAGTIRKLTKVDLQQQKRNLEILQEENRKRHAYYTRFR